MQSLRYAVTQVLKSRGMSYYAVAHGREVGIFDNWSKCEQQVKGFKGAKYKKFPTRLAAEEFLATNKVCKQNSLPSLENVIALGKQRTIEIWPHKEELPTTVNTNKATAPAEYWPESDGDSFELADNDFLNILHEVEGVRGATISGTRKRKASAETSIETYKFPKHASKIWEPVALKKIGAHEYKVDCEGFVICYTDGSCFNNGRKNAAAGFGVYFDDDHPLNAGRPVRGRVTNNAGEIQAAIHAIKTAKSHGIEKLCISTDSQFLINAITLWIKAWKQKGWRLKSGEPVKNMEDFKELDALLSDAKLAVKWNYVKGHKGIKGNEMADQLARKGTEIFQRMHSKR